MTTLLVRSHERFRSKKHGSCTYVQLICNPISLEIYVVFVGSIVFQVRAVKCCPRHGTVGKVGVYSIYPPIETHQVESEINFRSEVETKNRHKKEKRRGRITQKTTQHTWEKVSASSTQAYPSVQHVDPDQFSPPHCRQSFNVVDQHEKGRGVGRRGKVQNTGPLKARPGVSNHGAIGVTLGRRDSMISHLGPPIIDSQLTMTYRSFKGRYSGPDSK